MPSFAGMEGFPPGTIGVPCGDTARFNQFVFSLAGLTRPHPETKVIWCQGSSINRNLNTMVKAMYGEWFWMMGDDHTFEPDALLKLLRHDVDIVVPLVSTKRPPYRYVIFSEHEAGHFKTISPRELPEHGLVEVHAAGGAGMLIKRHVFEALGEPFFRNTTANLQDEDVNFCLRAREAGFKIWCDVDVRIGHMMVVPITPSYENGTWGFGVDFSDEDHLFLTYTPDE